MELAGDENPARRKQRVLLDSQSGPFSHYSNGSGAHTCTDGNGWGAAFFFLGDKRGF